VRTVSRLSVTPVKGLGLQHPEEIQLGERGVADNRRFYLVDRVGSLFSGIDHGPLVRVRPRYDTESEVLTLDFPDGRSVAGSALADGDEVETDFYGRRVTGRVMDGPFGEALSRYAGKPLRLVRADRDSHGCDVQTVTFLSDASVEELRGRAGREEPLDERRFRMLIGLGGCTAHEEDTWNGRLLAIGGAHVRVGGPVGRCATTTRDPSTGERDFDTLRAIKGYRGVREGKSIDFGVYGDVEQPGRVRIGDPVELVGEA